MSRSFLLLQNQNDVFENDVSPNNNYDVMFLGPKTTASQNDNQQQRNNGTKTNGMDGPIPNHISSCKTLQRKLEMKVERAKRNYSQFNQKNANKTEVRMTFVDIVVKLILRKL